MVRRRARRVDNGDVVFSSLAHRRVRVRVLAHSPRENTFANFDPHRVDSFFHRGSDRPFVRMDIAHHTRLKLEAAKRRRADHPYFHTAHRIRRLAIFYPRRERSAHASMVQPNLSKPILCAFIFIIESRITARLARLPCADRAVVDSARARMDVVNRIRALWTLRCLDRDSLTTRVASFPSGS